MASRKALRRCSGRMYGSSSCASKKSPATISSCSASISSQRPLYGSAPSLQARSSCRRSCTSGSSPPSGASMHRAAKAFTRAVSSRSAKARHL